MVAMLVVLSREIAPFTLTAPVIEIAPPDDFAEKPTVPVLPAPVVPVIPPTVIAPRPALLESKIKATLVLLLFTSANGEAVVKDGMVIEPPFDQIQTLEPPLIAD